jgi:hypothetical protein
MMLGSWPETETLWITLHARILFLDLVDLS